MKFITAIFWHLLKFVGVVHCDHQLTCWQIGDNVYDCAGQLQCETTLEIKKDN